MINAVLGIIGGLVVAGVIFAVVFRDGLPPWGFWR